MSNYPPGITHEPLDHHHLDLAEDAALAINAALNALAARYRKSHNALQVLDSQAVARPFEDDGIELEIELKVIVRTPAYSEPGAIGIDAASELHCLSRDWEAELK